MIDHSPSANTDDHIPEIIPYVSIPSGNPAAMAPRWEAEKEETSAAPMPTQCRNRETMLEREKKQEHKLMGGIVRVLLFKKKTDCGYVQ